MRNLHLQTYLRYKIAEITEAEIYEIEEFSETVYFITKDKYLFSVVLSSDTPQISIQQDLGSEIELSDKVVGLFYNLDLQALIIVCYSGNVFKYTILDNQFENIGALSSSIIGASVSPNQDLIVLASSEGQLTSLDTNFDVKKEISIDDQGAEIDAAQTVQISWKNDGKFFVTNYALKSGGRKALTRDTELNLFRSAAKSDPEGGIVQSVSETAVKNLLGPISFQKNANLVAGVDLHNGGSRIIFWEKNGLRHLEFDLPNFKDSQKPCDLQIAQIDYNKSGDLLAILASDELTQYVLFYYRSNYRWYLKKVVQANSKGKLVQFSWSETQYKIYLFYTNEIIEVLHFNHQHTPNQADTSIRENLSPQISIDNHKLLTTLFSKSILPPPLSDFDLNRDLNPIDTFAVSLNTVVVGGKSGFTAYKFDEKFNVKIQKFDFKLEPDWRVRHLVVLRESEEEILVAFLREEQNLTLVSLRTAEKTGSVVQELQFKNVLTLTADEKGFAGEPCENLVIQNLKGELFLLDLSRKGAPQSSGKLAQPCLRVVCCLNESGSRICIGLSSNGRLVSQSLISAECTSFLVYKGFLVFTTQTNTMYNALYLLGLAQALSLNPQLPKPDSKSLLFRNIERGCVLVNINDIRVILQAQRGNLEAFNHRVLTIKKVYQNIQEVRYRQAFELCRTNKLDLNLIFDLDPQRFQENAKKALQQIDNYDFLNVFLAQLRNTLSEEARYALSESQTREVEAYLRSLRSKINLICDLLITNLREIDEQKYSYTIITAHIKKEPSELNQVLAQIKRQKDEESRGTHVKVAPHLTPEHKKHGKRHSAEKMLEFVCWIAEANKIYDVALTLYDLELVTLVAKYTQKDPKEYLPYLESLREMEAVEMRARINIDLKMFERAVEELAKGTEEQKQRALALVRQHELFNVGYKVFKNEKQNLLKVKEYLGDYLLDKKQFQQAYLTYFSAEQYEKALTSCRQNWDLEKIRLIAQKLGYSQEQLAEIYEELKQEALEIDNNEVAGLIFLMQGQVDKALEQLIKSESWQEIAEIQNTLSEAQKLRVQEGIRLSTNIQINQFKQLRREFQDKHKRLLAVYEEKEAQPQLMQQLASGFTEEQKDSDLYSDISEQSYKTVESRSSYAVSETTGVRKKKDKNKGKSILRKNVKEGSVHEEQFLVMFLRDIQERKELFTKAKNTIQYLIFFDEMSDAELLNQQMKLFEETINIKIRTLHQKIYEQQHPEVNFIFQDLDFLNNEKPKAFEVSLNNFDYILK